MHLYSHRLLHTSLHPQASQVVREIYARKPDWWARWTWPLLLGITVWTAVGAETVFLHWTRPTEAVSNEGPAEKKVAVVPESQPPASKSLQRELRPIYQRALMSVSILGFGTGLGVLFLSARSRIVRRLLDVSGPAAARQITKPSQTLAKDRYIVVETVENWGPGKGKVYPKENCELRPGREGSEMLLRVRDVRDFWLGLDEAIIEGVSVPGGPWAVRQRLLESWGQGKKTGGIWKSGPIVEGRL